MEEHPQQGHHQIVMEDRKQCRMTGVKEVLAFDEGAVILDTEKGMLDLRGKGLHVSRLALEEGILEIDGLVETISYRESGSYKKQGESFWKRLLR